MYKGDFTISRFKDNHGKWVVDIDNTIITRELYIELAVRHYLRFGMSHIQLDYRDLFDEYKKTYNTGYLFSPKTKCILPTDLIVEGANNIHGFFYIKSDLFAKILSQSDMFVTFKFEGQTIWGVKSSDFSHLNREFDLFFGEIVAANEFTIADAFKKFGDSDPVYLKRKYKNRYSKDYRHRQKLTREKRKKIIENLKNRQERIQNMKKYGIIQ